MTRTMRKVKMMRMMVMINGLSNMYFLVYFRGPSIRTVHYGIAASCKWAWSLAYEKPQHSLLRCVSLCVRHFRCEHVLPTKSCIIFMNHKLLLSAFKYSFFPGNQTIHLPCQFPLCCRPVEMTLSASGAQLFNTEGNIFPSVFITTDKCCFG